MNLILTWHYLLTFVLNFDGSWYDNNNNSSLNSKSNKKRRITGISNCSACCYVNVDDDEDNDPSRRSMNLIAIGAKCLSRCPSSAHAEYEGLLLGLEILMKVVSSHYYDNDRIISRSSSGEREHCECKCEILIRGDCKTVLSQVQGSSIPRKLAREYERYLDLKSEIMRLNSIIIRYELVPRDENKCADCLGREIARCVQTYLYCQFRNDHVFSSTSPSSDIQSLYQKIEGQKLHLSPSQYFLLLCDIANRCMQNLTFSGSNTQENCVLERIGAELRLFPTHFAADSTTQKAICAKGIRYEIESMLDSGKHHEASAFERRHRYKLAMGSEIDPNHGILQPPSMRLEEEPHHNAFQDSQHKKAFYEWHKLLNESIRDNRTMCINHSLIHFVRTDPYDSV